MLPFRPMQRSSSGDLADVIGRIYEAAEDPLVWADVLRLLGNEFGSTVNVFVLSDKNSPQSEVVVSDGGDPKWEREYDDYYHSINIVLRRLYPFLAPGRVLSSADYFTDQELLASEYYNEFLRRRDVFYLIGGTVNASPTSNSLLTMVRSRRRRAWTNTEKERLSRLMPHLQRASRLSGNFARLRQERDEIVNRLPMGIIVLTESGKIGFLNPAAEAILTKKDGLYGSANGIDAADPIESSHLRTMILGAKLTASRKDSSGGGSLSITRSAGRPLSVLVAPLMPTALTPASQSPRVAIFISDPDVTQPTNMERLTSMFNLTPAESKMADQLVQGKTLGDAADELNITLETARTHLKRIFGKTCTGRQSELMRLLVSSPAALRD